MNEETGKYFDLHTTGIGYLQNVQEVESGEDGVYVKATIAALRGSSRDTQYTHFECDVTGRKAIATLRELKSAVDGKLKVLVGFTLSNLHAEQFTYADGELGGQKGVRLKARLLRISYAKVDGQPFVTEAQATA